MWALALLALGTDLHVIDLRGNAVPVSPGKSQATAVLFISAICPVSNAYNERMVRIYKDYSARGVQFLFVNANSNEPAAKVAEHREAAAYPFQVYMDKNNALADRLGAQMTPEAIVLDAHGEVRYRGFIDDAKNPARVTNQGLRGALDAVLAGKPVPTPETKSFGCTIHRVRKK
jgi:AhpC/TSA family